MTIIDIVFWGAVGANGVTALWHIGTSWKMVRRYRRTITVTTIPAAESPSRKLRKEPLPEAEETEQPIYAWRGFHLSAWTARLQSYNGLTWLTRELEAVCLQDSARPLAKEHLEQYDCDCGIYAYKDARRVGRDCPTVVGHVSLRGVVVEHEDGYRAERARIEKLYLLASEDYHSEIVNVIMAALAERYGCAVVQIRPKRFEELATQGYLEATT